jgi:hypothetical protein
MPAKEILAAIRELHAAGWRVELTNGRAKAGRIRKALAECPR